MGKDKELIIRMKIYPGSALSAEHGAWAVRVHDVAKSRAAVIAGNTWREYA